MNRIVINGSSINEGNGIDMIGTQEAGEFTPVSITYKSSQFDHLMNEYLKDYNQRNNRGSLSNLSKSNNNRSVSPNQLIRSQYSSGEFIEISAPDL